MIDLAALIEETPERFRLDPRLYDDPELFELEMQRIFERTWVYVGHESEVAQAGAFRTGTVGSMPVIVSRGRDGGLRVFRNVCRHRGNVLCRDAGGVANSFACRYHGWVYGNDGALLSIPSVEAYPEAFRQESGALSLLEARCASYRGLIFANLDGAAEPLVDYLGGVRAFVDLWADLAPAGTLRVAEPHAYSYRGNWKFQVENAVDMYHPAYVHQSAFNAFRRSGLVRYQSNQQPAVVGAAKTYGFANGHAVLERAGLETVYTAEQLERYRAALGRRHAPERVEQIAAIRHVQLFPNVCLMDGNIRVTQPVSVDRTNVYSYFTRLDGVDEDINDARLDDYQRRVSTTGLVGTDDVDIFAGNQTGIRALRGRSVILDRGADREVVHPNGMREGGPTDETPQRAIYRGWRAAMQAGR